MKSNSLKRIRKKFSKFPIRTLPLLSGIILLFNSCSSNQNSEVKEETFNEVDSTSPKQILVQQQLDNEDLTAAYSTFP